MREIEGEVLMMKKKSVALKCDLETNTGQEKMTTRMSRTTSNRRGGKNWRGRWGMDWLRSIWPDMRYGLRMLRMNPGFAASLILTLALGIGANCAIFSIANTLLFRPLPFQNSQRLVAIWNETKEGDRLHASIPDLEDWRRQSQIFEGVAGYFYQPDDGYVSTTTTGGEVEHLSRIQVSVEFFDLLGVHPMLGHSFPPDESQKTVVIGCDLWKTRFGGRVDILGQTIIIDNSHYIVVGVMPQSFRLFRNNQPEIYTPLFVPLKTRYERGTRFLEIVARLKPGIGQEQASIELKHLSLRREADCPETNRGIAAKLEALHEHLLGKRRALFQLLLATAGFVLLIGCANVANLLLARTINREREIAIRTSMGASRWRITRQLLTESGLFAILGGGVGLLFSRWAVQGFNAFTTAADLALQPIQMDGRVIGFALFLITGTAILFGMAPALYAAKADLITRLKRASAACSGRPAAQRWSGILIAGEVAVALVLLVGMGLLLKSIFRLSQTHVGFETERILTMSISSRYPREFASMQIFSRMEHLFWPQLLSKLGSLPGVHAVAVSQAFPLSSDHEDLVDAPIEIVGRQLPAPGYLLAEIQDVSPGYFQATGIPLMRGRLFDDHDILSINGSNSVAPPVVINESFARDQWMGQNPIGQRIVIGSPFTIIGIVGNVRQHGPRLQPTKRQVYMPVRYAELFKQAPIYLIVRTWDKGTGVSHMVKDVVQQLDPGRSVGQARTMKQVIFSNTALDHLNVAIVAFFGMSAVFLTLIGIHGAVVRTISMHTKEIGIRTALGSQPSGIIRLFMRQGVVTVLFGITIGLIGAGLGARLMASQFFGVNPSDPFIYGGVSLLLLVVSLLSYYVPARGATRIDPISALRCE
jgi:predicted permease